MSSRSLYSAGVSAPARDDEPALTAGALDLYITGQKLSFAFARPYTTSSLSIPAAMPPAATVPLTTLVTPTYVDMKCLATIAAAEALIICSFAHLQFH